jgi:hypothetical protein
LGSENPDGYLRRCQDWQKNFAIGLILTFSTAETGTLKNQGFIYGKKFNLVRIEN